MANKIKYGLKNVHAALQTQGEGGAYTYGTPQAIPGAVSMSLDAENPLATTVIPAIWSWH